MHCTGHSIKGIQHPWAFFFFFFLRLFAFSQKIKQLWTKYPMDPELPTLASCNQEDSLHQSGRFFILHNLMDKKFPESGRLSNLCTQIGLFPWKSGSLLQNQEGLAALWIWWEMFQGTQKSALLHWRPLLWGYGCSTPLSSNMNLNLS